MNTIKWDDFKGLELSTPESPWAPTNIECPKCGHLLEINRSYILTTYPPKNDYRCPICGWKGAK